MSSRFQQVSRKTRPVNSAGDGGHAVHGVRAATELDHALSRAAPRENRPARASGAPRSTFMGGSRTTTRRADPAPIRRTGR